VRYLLSTVAEPTMPLLPVTQRSWVELLKTTLAGETSAAPILAAMTRCPSPLKTTATPSGSRHGVIVRLLPVARTGGVLQVEVEAPVQVTSIGAKRA